MSSVITANLLSEAVNRNKNDASLLSLPGYEIIKCIFENNFNKVYLSVSNHPRSLSAQKDAIFVIKSIAVDVSPTDFSELLLTQTNTNDDNKIDQINAHLEVQLDVTASLAAEINILKLVSHTNIIELHYVFCEVSIDFGGHLFLVMEHASVGPIMKLTQKCQAIQSNNDNQSDDNLNSFFPEYYCPYTDTRTIGESLISRILEQLLSALIYFHSKNIIHRDIKVENILFTHDGSIKLSDFGSSSQLSSECAGQVDDTAGTFLYWSPEICDEDRDCALYNGFKADIWALGMTMWICLFSKPPYYCDSPLTLFEMIAQQEDYINSPDFTLLLTLPHICSTPLADVLRGLLQREPHKRLSSEECSQMPFITDRYTSTEIDNTVRGEVNFSFIIRHRIFQWKRNAQRKVKRQCDVLSSNIQNSIQSSSASARDNIIETNTSDSAHLHEQGKTRRNSVSNFIASAFRSLNPFGK